MQKKRTSVYVSICLLIFLFILIYRNFQQKKVLGEQSNIEESIEGSLGSASQDAAVQPIFIPAPSPTPNEEYVKEIALWDLVNSWRRAHSLEEFFIDEKLCGFATQRTQQLDDDLSHQKFLDLSEEFKTQTGFTKLGENLVSGVIAGKEDQVLTAWLDSEKHLKNLQDDFVYSCIKCRDIYCVQLFASF